MQDANMKMMESFVNPQAVALIGVSSRTGPGSFNILEQMQGSGYTGSVYPVNPRGGSILGVPVYTSVLAIDMPVDLAVIATPRTAVPGVIRQCVQKNIPAVIVITQGFSDADDETGQILQREILAAIEGTGTRVVGPNTLGVINNFTGFNSGFLKVTISANPVGLICQSGIFLAAGQDFAGGMGIGIDPGNTSDIRFAECLDYLGQNHAIQVINMYLEGLQDGREFMEVARRVTPNKPVLVIKGGSSAEGARAAISHSGSLAGEDAVFTAAFEQSGIIRVAESARLAALNRTFYTYNQMSGPKVGIITISGGAGIMVVDACSKHGLVNANLAPATIAGLEQDFPDWMKAGNPADIWPGGMARGYDQVLARSLETMLTDAAVDAVILITPAYQPPEEDPLNVIDVVRTQAALYPDKPTALWIFGPHKQEYANIVHQTGQLVVYQSPDEAAYCLSQLYRYHSSIKNKHYEPIAVQGGGPDLGAQLAHGASVTLNEKALDIVEQNGIPVARRLQAVSEEDALQAADMIGYPVVLKVISPQITHKSDVGGVKLNIQSPADLIEAYREMMRLLPEKVPGAVIEGFLIQESINRGTEIILGAKRDPQFGPVLVYGLGGIYAEILRDVVFRVAPVTRQEALAMIQATKSYQFISGFRGEKPGDLQALAHCIVQLGQLMCTQPTLTEVDINPLLVQPEGCIALDARMVLSKP